MNITYKRVQEEPGHNDGTGVLVDRVWPRGVSKDDAQLDDWNKDVAPSTDLRKWFSHTPGFIAVVSSLVNDDDIAASLAEKEQLTRSGLTSAENSVTPLMRWRVAGPPTG